MKNIRLILSLNDYPNLLQGEVGMWFHFFVLIYHDSERVLMFNSMRSDRLGLLGHGAPGKLAPGQPVSGQPTHSFILTPTGPLISPKAGLHIPQYKHWQCQRKLITHHYSPVTDTNISEYCSIFQSDNMVFTFIWQWLQAFSNIN